MVTARILIYNYDELSLSTMHSNRDSREERAAAFRPIAARILAWSVGLILVVTFGIGMIPSVDWDTKGMIMLPALGLIMFGAIGLTMISAIRLDKRMKRRDD